MLLAPWWKINLAFKHITCQTNHHLGLNLYFSVGLREIKTMRILSPRGMVPTSYPKAN